MTDPATGGGRSSEERPNERPDPDIEEVAPLDETPDGRTPSDTTESSEDSLPPG